MKTCKSCMKKIDEKATKCPFCREDQRGFFSKHKVISGILLIFLLIASGIFWTSFASWFFPKPDPTLTPENQKWITDAGKRYYDSQKAYYDKLGPALHYPSEELDIIKDIASGEATMKLCLYKLDKQHCENVVDGTVWIGEPKFWVQMTIGTYTSSRNTTTTHGVTHEQWVYGNPLYGASYAYFDNDILTSYQQQNQTGN